MTDIHNHLLYGVDDGSSSIEESIELIKKEVKCGFDTIILTPHFIKHSEYNFSREENLKRVENLKKALKKENINVNILLGNEIFISNTVVDDLDNNIISTLGNSKYILIEFPLRDQIINIEDVVYNIKQDGYIPIIAHPERYSYLKDDYTIIENLKADGVLFQCNYGSIGGYYGKRAKKLVKRLLKDHYVNFMATDFHRESKTYVVDKFKTLERKVRRTSGKKNYKEIVNNSDMIAKI